MVFYKGKYFGNWICFRYLMCLELGNYSDFFFNILLTVHLSIFIS